MRSIIPLFAVVFTVSAPALASELVPVPPFRSIELRGGGNVELVRGPTQRVTFIEGSSQFTRVRVDSRGRLRIDACNDQCPNYYRLRVQIETPRVPDVGVSGGGEIRAASGFSPQNQLSAAVNGGGKIDVRQVHVSNVSAAVNGGGQLFVQPLASLSAAVNGGGEVRYWGRPQVMTAIQGGGVVRPGN